VNPGKHLAPTYGKGTAEILKANPTRINTIPNVKTYSSELS
jgi:hypothetical protein